MPINETRESAKSLEPMDQKTNRHAQERRLPHMHWIIGQRSPFLHFDRGRWTR